MTKVQDIRDMYTHLRETNQNIPSECLDFMLSTCLKALEDSTKVKIKTWKAMEEEFGLDSDGYIDCDKLFVVRMEEEIPEDRIILLQKDDNDDWCWKSESCSWHISKDMIEEYL